MTPIQRTIVAAIALFKVENHYAPTVRELAALVGTSPSTMHHHLDALERQGRISRRPNMPRTTVVNPEEPDDPALEDLPEPGGG